MRMETGEVLDRTVRRLISRSECGKYRDFENVGQGCNDSYNFF